MSTLIRVPLADRTNSTQSNPSHSNTKIDQNAESHHKQTAAKSSRATATSQSSAVQTPPTLTSSSPPSDVVALEPRSTRIPLIGTPIAQLLTDALTTLQPSNNQAIAHNTTPSQSIQPSIGESHKSISTQSNRNLESSHATIASLRRQMAEMKDVASTLMERMARRAGVKEETTSMNAHVDATSSSLAAPLPSFISPSSSSSHTDTVNFDDSSVTLPSPITSASSTPYRTRREEENQALAEQNAILAEENQQLRHELDSLRRQFEMNRQQQQEQEEEPIVSPPSLPLNVIDLAEHHSQIDGLETRLASLQSSVTTLESTIAEKDRQLFVANQVRRKLADQVHQLKGNIRVVCRVRPKLEKESHLPIAVHTERHSSMVSVDLGPQRPLQSFEFDSTLGMDSGVEQLYEEVDGLIRAVMDGFNVAILAYGVSGSGKTHSMTSLTHHALTTLFQHMSEHGNEYEYEVKLNMVEIYLEQIRDLLLQYHDGSEPSTGLCEVQTSSSSSAGSASVQVKGAVTLRIHSLDEVESYVKSGHANRTSSATQLNTHSSRSHCIITLTVTSTHRLTGTRLYGKLHLTDLAGQESLQDGGNQLRETQHINKSLANLSLVFQALSKKEKHVPYRNSQLN